MPSHGTHEAEPDVVDEALAAFGLQQTGGEDEEPAPPDAKCYLWPCNVPAFRLWHRVQTQWRVGMEGRSGLDYAAVTAYMREVLRVKPREWAGLFAGLQAMEFAALEVWAEKNN